MKKEDFKIAMIKAVPDGLFPCIGIRILDYMSNDDNVSATLLWRAMDVIDTSKLYNNLNEILL